MDDAQSLKLLCELLREFTHAWLSGTGGGICRPTILFLAPTGVHKERIRPDEFFTVDPPTAASCQPDDPALRPSECNAIFSMAARERGARSVVHSHALSAVLAADLADADGGDHVAIRDLEMLKGIRGLTNRTRTGAGDPEHAARGRADRAARAGPRRPRFASAYAVVGRRPRRLHLGRRRLGGEAPHGGLSLPVRGGGRTDADRRQEPTR